jgi:hypothetical protein
MPLGVDVGIIEHGMAMAADMAASVWLALDQHRPQARAILGANLR